MFSILKYDKYGGMINTIQINHLILVVVAKAVGRIALIRMIINPISTICRKLLGLAKAISTIYRC